MVCAVDIGGTFTKVALVSLSGLVSRFTRIPTAPPVGEYVDRLVQAIARARENAEVSAIGVSLAGFIDASHSALSYNPNIAWLEGFPLRSRLAAACSLPVSLEVDSNAAALAEFRLGQGVGCPRFLCLTVGTGIGGGLVVDGQLVRFTEECIGDVGHIIVDPGGRLCTCGGRGCAEAVATAPAILAIAGSTASALEDLPSSPELDAIFARTGQYLGLLAASLASIFFPGLIAFGGGVCAASPLVLAAAQAEFAHSAGHWARAHTHIAAARLASRASLVGAACATENALM